MTHEQWKAIFLSLQVAATSTVVSLPLAIAAAALLAKRRGVARLVLDTAVNLPLVLPPVVTGFLLLTTFGRNSVLGRLLNDWLGLNFVFDFNGAVLAASVVAFPLMVRAIRLSIESVDQNLILAAKTLGSSPWACFWKVTLPLSRRGLVAGSMLAFARGLGEFGATIMLAGNIVGETKTIPLFVFDQLQAPGGVKNCWPVILFSVGIAMAALFISGRFDPSASERC